MHSLLVIEYVSYFDLFGAVLQTLTERFESHSLIWVHILPPRFEFCLNG